MHQDQTFLAIDGAFLPCVQPLYIHRQWAFQNWDAHRGHQRANSLRLCKWCRNLLLDAVVPVHFLLTVVGMFVHEDLLVHLPGWDGQSIVACEVESYGLS